MAAIDQYIERIPNTEFFVTLLWQNHPFREGNTRTTAVFVIKYLRSIGFFFECQVLLLKAIAVPATSRWPTQCGCH